MADERADHGTIAGHRVCTRDAGPGLRLPFPADGLQTDSDTRGNDAAMVTRLSASDASFYQLENTSTPMYVGSLSILRKPRAG